jgi:nucleoside-diphosphate-sugar epimerase
MKILITGAAGFLGGRIVDRLLARGQSDLRLGVRQGVPAAQLERWRGEHGEARIEVTPLNLLAREGLGPALAGVDTIIHAAAGTKGGVADMFMNSVVGTRNLLDAVATSTVRRIVLVSSFSVYRTVDLPSHDVLTEASPLEAVGVEKGGYAYTKVQQEQLFRDYQARQGFESVVVRPGVIYGPGGGAMSSRVGISALGIFASLGRSNLLPLNHVDNCADAIAHATVNAPANGVYNLVDDDLPSCAQYLREYRRKVKALKVVPLPYPALTVAAKWLTRYSERSGGQLPAVLTPYVVRSMYRPLRYSNQAIKALGWTQRVSVDAGMADFFEHLKRTSP